MADEEYSRNRFSRYLLREYSITIGSVELARLGLLVLRSLRPDGSGRIRGETRGGATAIAEAIASVFPLRCLENCARITRTTRERSSPPAPQALRPGELHLVW